MIPVDTVKHQARFPSANGERVQHLLPLVPVRGTSSEFGYLFRHYWIPATTLYYRETTESTGVDRSPETTRSEYRVRMKKCDSDQCIWRERPVFTDPDDVEAVRLLPLRDDEIICQYDRTKQTVWTKPVLSFVPSQRDAGAARMEALLRQPLMAPLLPIPVGFQWYVQTDDARMEFRLESVLLHNETEIAEIRRSGSFTIDRVYVGDELRHGRFTVRREGVTWVAMERSVVLEDETRDVLCCSDRLLDGTEIRTRRTLIRSEREKTATLAPLFQKYQAASGGHLYDCATGHLIQSDDTLFEIADDIGILSNNEIRAKYRHLDQEKLDVALSDLESLQGAHVLSGHEPCELSRVERVYQNRRERDLGDFWQSTSLMLILGVTEKCNLNCAYCCYSGKFAGQRTHGLKSMTWEVAKTAIAAYLASDHAGTSCPISFYGGEPLLEFNLFQECVRFAVRTGEASGKDVRFALTTNGTLLDDETVDFLVEHEFLVMVSLDGPKEAHDRYRVFTDGRGSFDVIERNLRRFVERYPDYPHRGLNITLAPPFDLDATAKLVDEFFPFFPLSRANMVNTGAEYRFTESQTSPLQYGCQSVSTCHKNAGKLDSFRRFGKAEQTQLKEYWDMAVFGITQDGAIKSWEKIPFAMMLFEPQIGIYHRRPVTDKRPEWLFSIPCLPGFTRRYVDVDGNYRICERVDNSEGYILGNVFSGLDTDKLNRTMELRRHFGDCGNCTALKVCDFCYARIHDSDRAESGYDPLLERQCRETRRVLPKMLKTYTEIMDANPQAFDTPTDEDTIRYQQIKYGAPGSRLDRDILQQLELETF